MQCEYRRWSGGKSLGGRRDCKKGPDRVSFQSLALDIAESKGAPEEEKKEGGTESLPRNND